MDKKNTLKKEFNEYKEQKQKQKLIDEITGIEKQRKNISKAKPTPKPKQRNKNIWWLLFQDTPAYLKKAPLERAMREYEVGIKREKSALDNFAEKYIIDEKLEIIPIDYFGEKAPQLKEFFRNQKY